MCSIKSVPIGVSFIAGKKSPPFLTSQYFLFHEWITFVLGWTCDVSGKSEPVCFVVILEFPLFIPMTSHSPLFQPHVVANFPLFGCISRQFS